MNKIQKLGFAILCSTIFAFGHGSVTPQAVDTTGLDKLGTEWLEENPYKTDNKIAVEIQKGENEIAELQFKKDNPEIGKEFAAQTPDPGTRSAKSTVPVPRPDIPQTENFRPSTADRAHKSRLF